jgi:hypothetical protein
MRDALQLGHSLLVPRVQGVFKHKLKEALEEGNT